MSKVMREAPVEGRLSSVEEPWPPMMSDLDRGSGAWTAYRPRYSIEDELLDRLERLPSPDDVEDVVSRLRLALLREMSVGIINSSIDFAKGGERLQFARQLNSWMATAEETASAGKRLRQILARRKKSHV